MSLSKEPSDWSPSWFKVGIISVFVLSLCLRFWGLGRFNSLVFDEVYYVKFAHDYLTQTPLFDGHPPLSKYLIAIGIWIGNQLPIGRDTVNSLAGAPYSTWSYRWLGALTGSFIPLVIAGIAYQVSHRRRYAFLAALFAALDGLFLVESRYALNNVYLVIFGLLGLWCLLLALNGRSLWRSAWLLLAGIFWGASASIKWNGLWFLVGAYGLWLTAWVIDSLRRWFFAEPASMPGTVATGAVIDRSSSSPLQRLARIAPWQVVLNFGLIPAVFYRLIWIPHLKFNTTVGFWELQKQMLEYHERVGNGPQVHPYCSDWYTWIVMLRPVAYYYKVEAVGGPLMSSDPAVHPGSTVIYDVHAMGNPVLWWLSTAAMLLMMEALLLQLIVWCIQRWRSGGSPHAIAGVLNPTDFCLWLLLVLSEFAQLVIQRSAAALPWNPTPILIGLKVVLAVSLLYRFITKVRIHLTSDGHTHSQPQVGATELWLVLVLVVNYVANLLPWVGVTRCKIGRASC